MHAMILNGKREFVWSEVADPVPGANDVVIRIHAAALNRADLLQRDGNYPPPPGWPEWPGLEVAGVIESAPAVSRWKKGERVCALLGGGGYAEKVAVPQDMVLPVPEHVSLEEAAGIPEVFATAFLNLTLIAEMKSGDTVFIQAGASGLGLAAIQLAKRCGAKVITTVGSDEKGEFVRKLGADWIVNRRKESLPAVLEANPPDIALDCVAGPGLGECVVKMARGGRWIVLATLGGKMTQIDMDLFFKRGVRLIGSTLRSRSSEEKARILGELERTLWPEFSAGRVKSILHKVLPISQVEEAHRILRDGENIGKVVLTVE